jgi:DegV family protein with EDD domain
MPVAVVTDSTAYLPDEVARAHGVTVVPLAVVISDEEGREGLDITPADVALALSGRRVAVTTSRPAPAAFAAAYRGLFESGATGVVSVHLSRALSGTYDAAVLAAGEFGERVAVVDSRGTAMGLGFPTLAAASAAASGQDLARVRGAALAAIDRTTTLFYVDTLEYLRRGGRIGVASALVGTALSVKPILSFVDGVIILRDKVRTAGRALARLVDIAVESAGESDVDVAVHHLGARDRAAQLLHALADRLGSRLRDQYICEIGAAVAAHVGPGFAGVVVHRRP